MKRDTNAQNIDLGPNINMEFYPEGTDVTESEYPKIKTII